LPPTSASLPAEVLVLHRLAGTCCSSPLADTPTPVARESCHSTPFTPPSLRSPERCTPSSGRVWTGSIDTTCSPSRSQRASACLQRVRGPPVPPPPCTCCSSLCTTDWSFTSVSFVTSCNRAMQRRSAVLPVSTSTRCRWSRSWRSSGDLRSARCSRRTKPRSPPCSRRTTTSRTITPRYPS
jgi:hypothetical protein